MWKVLYIPKYLIVEAFTFINLHDLNIKMVPGSYLFSNKTAGFAFLSNLREIYILINIIKL